MRKATESVTLRKLKQYLGPPMPKNNPKVAFLDVETTGLDSTVDEVIEIGYIIVRYSPDNGQLGGTVKRRDYLGEPHAALSETIQIITGLTDEDLKGKKIPWDDVVKDLQDVDFIVAHNAAFDRAFCEKYAHEFRNIPWADSLTQVDWLLQGHTASRSLELLCLHLAGCVYDSHRALADAEALAYLLNRRMISDPDKTYFSSLLAAHQAPFYLLTAYNAPFGLKDGMKARGYRWNPTLRAWQFSGPDVESEITWLKGQIGSSYAPRVETIPATDRFRR